MRNRARRISIAAVTLGFLTLSGVAPAHADVDDFEFTSVEVDYYLSQDDDGRAALTIVETWVALFPEDDQNKGIVRQIPTRDGYTDLRLEVVGVTDENGDDVVWEDGDGNGQVLEIDDDEYKHGETTYVIEYTMADVVRDLPDGDEFYPDVTGTDWEQPIDAVTARLHVTGAVEQALDGRVACFTGDLGSTESDCTTDTSTGTTADWPASSGVSGGEDTTIITVTGGPLEPEENLSYVVGFDAGAFAHPPTPGAVYVAPGFGVAAVVLALLHLAIVLIVRLRDAAARPRPRIVQYTPPRGISIRVSAVVLGKRSRLIAAHTVDLAVRRFLGFGATDQAKPDPKKFTLSPVVSQPAGTPDDAALMDALFGAGKRKSFRLDKTSTKRVKRLTAYSAASIDRAKEDGVISGRRLWPVTVGIVLAALALASIIVLFVLGTQGFVPGWIAAATIIPAFAIFVLAFILTPLTVALTKEGRELEQYLQGMREYIALAEADRLTYLQSPTTATLGQRIEPEEAAAGEGDLRLVHIYERLLPYAVLFGLEKQWSAVLREVDAGLPDGTSTSNVLVYQALATSHFASSMSTQASYIASSSGDGGTSGSGFGGGGGFSGGGFGGGGGGGR